METVVTLLLVGAVLLLMEIVLPGMIAGLIGIGCVIAAVVVTFVEFGAEAAGMVALGSVIAIVVGFFLWLKYFPSSRIGKMFVSETAIGGLDVEVPDILGKQGSAICSLRPSGAAEIEGRRYDVVAEGGWIEQGSAVKVVSAGASRIVVRAIAENMD